MLQMYDAAELYIYVSQPVLVIESCLNWSSSVTVFCGGRIASGRRSFQGVSKRHVRLNNLGRVGGVWRSVFVRATADSATGWQPARHNDNSGRHGNWCLWTTMHNGSLVSIYEKSLQHRMIELERVAVAHRLWRLTSSLWCCMACSCCSSRDRVLFITVTSERL